MAAAERAAKRDTNKDEHLSSLRFLSNAGFHCEVRKDYANLEHFSDLVPRSHVNFIFK
jgi:hypothetical protein